MYYNIIIFSPQPNLIFEGCFCANTFNFRKVKVYNRIKKLCLLDNHLIGTHKNIKPTSIINSVLIISPWQTVGYKLFFSFFVLFDTEGWLKSGLVIVKQSLVVFLT